MNVIPTQIRIAAYVVAALAVAGVGYMIYDAIYDRGYEAAVVVKDAEAAAKEKANNEAIDKAKSGLNETVAKLIIEKERLEADVERLSAEAAADPDAANGGIGTGSVQRINSVR